MAQRPKPVTRTRSRGTALALGSVGPLPHARQGIRGICKDLVQKHTTEVALRLREGMLSENLRLAHKYLLLVASYESGKPVETHRMVSLQDGPTGAIDLSKLSTEEKQGLLVLLRRAKDTTGPSSEG